MDNLPSMLAHRAPQGSDNATARPQLTASFASDQPVTQPLPPNHGAASPPLAQVPGRKPLPSHETSSGPTSSSTAGLVRDGSDAPIPVERSDLPIPVASEFGPNRTMGSTHDRDAKYGHLNSQVDENGVGGSNDSPPAPPYSSPLPGYASTDSSSTQAARDFKHGPGHQYSPPQPQQQFQHQNSWPSQSQPQQQQLHQTQSHPDSSRPRAESRPSGSKALRRYPGLPALDYRLYSPPLFDLNEDGTTIKSRAPHLSATVSALSALMRSLATVPPKPQVHITGNRGRKIDFKIKLNLMPLLVPDDPKRRSDYVRCVGRGEVALRGGQRPDINPEVTGGLDGWVRKFVEDPAPIRSFELERQVANLDVAWLEMQIRGLVATTAYKGDLKVEFPVTHARVVVQTPDKVNKFFTSMSKMLGPGKNTYEVVKAVWPFASHRPGEAARVCTVQSEEVWWNEWIDPIKYAIATKRHGWVTNEDKLEALMEGVGKGISLVEWGTGDDLGQPGSA